MPAHHSASSHITQSLITFSTLLNHFFHSPSEPMQAEGVFKALVHIIELLSKKKFHNFRPVLDAYIQRHFSGATAHRSLIPCLRNYITLAKTQVGQK